MNMNTICSQNCHEVSCFRWVAGATGTVLIVSAIAFAILAHMQSAWLQSGLGMMGDPHSWAMWTTFGGTLFVGGIALAVALLRRPSTPSQNISVNETPSRQVIPGTHSGPSGVEPQAGSGIGQKNNFTLERFLNALEIMPGNHKIIQNQDGVIVSFNIRLTITNSTETQDGEGFRLIKRAIQQLIKKVQGYLNIKCAFTLELIVREGDESLNEEIALVAAIQTISWACPEIINIKGRYAGQADDVLCFGNTSSRLQKLTEKNQKLRKRLLDMPLISKEHANQTNTKFNEICSQVSLTHPTIDSLEESEKRYIPFMALKFPDVSL